MYKIKKNTVFASEIFNYFGIKFNHNDFEIKQPSSLLEISDYSIVFYTKFVNKNFKILDKMNYDLKKLSNFKNIILITSKEFENIVDIPIIISENPKLDFVKILLEFFSEFEFQSGIDKSSIVMDGAKVGNNVFIGPHCFIGNNVSIGNNCKIYPNTSIFGNTCIGDDTIILSNSSIGGPGFSFLPDNSDYVHFPQLGSLRIGNNVWIGSNTTIERGTIDSTIIEDNVMIDTLVNIGHNCIIKKNSVITASCTICGKAEIGHGCYVGPNSVIEVGCYIGNDSIIGSSSLVRNNFDPNSVIFGSPGKLIRKSI